MLGSARRVSAARYSRMGGAMGAQPKGSGGLMMQSFKRLPRSPSLDSLVLDPEAGVERLHAERDAPVADDHHRDRDERVDGEPLPAPAERDAQVQVDAVDEPGDEGPD